MTTNAVKVIAEIANAHEGSFGKLCKMVEIAVESKADAVKFQLYRAKKLVAKDHPKYENYQIKEFSEEEWIEISNLCREKGIEVVPLVVPSSILLALMSSGMNGQNFTFNGYLPIEKTERKIALKQLERLSFDKKQTQIFIETPYRNNKILEDICTFLNKDTRVCVACDITLPTEYIKTKTVNDWKHTAVDLHKRPTIFIIQKD